jgi:hypothetical protein
MAFVEGAEFARLSPLPPKKPKDYKAEPGYGKPGKQTQGGGNEGLYTLEEAMNLVWGMMPQYTPPKEDTLSWKESQKIAEKRLNPLWEQYMDQVRGLTTNKLLESGYYGQLPGDKKLLENMDQVEAQRIAAIGDMAESLFRTSRDYASSRADRAYAQYQQDIQNRLSALGMAQNLAAQKYGRGSSGSGSQYAGNPLLNMLIDSAGTESYGDTFNAISSTLAKTYGIPESTVTSALSGAVSAPNYDLADWMMQVFFSDWANQSTNPNWFDVTK